MNRTILPRQTVDVNSTAISTIGYQYDNYRLRITYQNGSEYEYKSVPSHVFEGLRNSNSKGKFLNKYILWDYKFTLVN